MAGDEFVSDTERISGIFSRIMMHLSGSDEITPAQLNALKHIGQHGPCSISSLAEGLCVSQPAATMLVDRMLKKSLVERRPSESDRRQAEVSLTRTGKSLLKRIETERAQRLSAILLQMPPEERERFAASLECFIEAALTLESSPDRVCMHCGCEHQEDCIVNQTQLALAGEEIERK